MPAAKKKDFAAARRDVNEVIAANEVRLAKVRERVAATSLDVTLHVGEQADLDAAAAEEARLLSVIALLAAGLPELDKREAAQQEVDAAAARVRLQSRLAAAEAQLTASTSRAVQALSILTTHVAAVALAEREAVGLSVKLGEQRRYPARQDLGQAVLSRLAPHLAPYLPLQPPRAGQAAEGRLRGL
jgi:hypothetical protein